MNHGAVQNAHTDTHTETRQVHVVWTTPLKEFFLSSLVSEVKLSPFLSFFIEVVSIAIQSRISGCKMQKAEKEEVVYCHVVLVVCVSRRVFGVPA